MESMKDKKVLLSLKNVEVKFNVRGRILTAIRNVSLDVYENESLAIVGESGSGKSVLTKTFAGMLETNGFISNGSIILADDEISQTTCRPTPAPFIIASIALVLPPLLSIFRLSTLLHVSISGKIILAMRILPTGTSMLAIRR